MISVREGMGFRVMGDYMAYWHEVYTHFGGGTKIQIVFFLPCGFARISVQKNNISEFRIVARQIPFITVYFHQIIKGLIHNHKFSKKSKKRQSIIVHREDE